MVTTEEARNLELWVILEGDVFRISDSSRMALRGGGCREGPGAMVISVESCQLHEYVSTS